MSNEQQQKTTAIAPWQAAVSDLQSPKGMAALQAALPKHADAGQLVRSFVTAIRSDRTGKLSTCTKASLTEGVMLAAQLGLSLAPAMGQAYLVPFWDKKAGANVAQFIPGYRGLITLAYQTGQLAKIVARPVYRGDQFRYQYGTQELLEHVPAETNRGELRAAYCVTWLKGSTEPTFTVVEMADIDRAEASSKSSEYGPWKTHKPEMAVKTAVRRHMRFIPMSADDKATNILAQSIHLDDLIEAGQGQPRVATHGSISLEQIDVPESFVMPDSEPIDVRVEDLVAGGQAEDPAPRAYATAREPAPAKRQQQRHSQQRQARLPDGEDLI